ncbi:MAG: hypothetical protein HY023_15810 [Chloroflexi bacterium]|nr:hypothetical protein [Chloroflexota bacterium]MBI3760487.1 hypothetical protein [Chloroflexota bacterium]
MSASTILAQNSRFKIGWIILLVSAALMTLNHLGLIFFLGNPTLFAGFAAFNLYAFMVILIPFRRGEKWAWVTTWILPIGLAAPAFIAGNGNIAIFYYAVAAVCVLGLLLTMRDFFSRS